MSSDDTTFVLYYSYNLTKLHSTLQQRIANLIAFLQIILGSAVAIDVYRLFSISEPQYWTLIIGFIIAFLSAFSFVYKPSETAALSQLQFSRYKSLISKLQADPNIDIAQEMDAINSFDLPISGGIEYVAYKRAAIQLDLQDDTTLTFRQKIIAFLAGEDFDN